MTSQQSGKSEEERSGGTIGKMDTREKVTRSKKKKKIKVKKRDASAADVSQETTARMTVPKIVVEDFREGGARWSVLVAQAEFKWRFFPEVTCFYSLGRQVLKKVLEMVV